MAGDKYKIKIVRTGIGDPFLLGEFQFDLDGGIDPSIRPLKDLEIKVEMGPSGGDLHTYGYIVLKKNLTDWATGSGDAARYFFGMPFDPTDNYDDGDAIQLRLTFQSTDSDEPGIELDGGSNNHSTFDMTYLSSMNTNFPSVPVYYYWEA